MRGVVRTPARKSVHCRKQHPRDRDAEQDRELHHRIQFLHSINVYEGLEDLNYRDCGRRAD
jgi:hypothetical protein